MKKSILKLLSTLLILCMVFSLAACGESAEETASAEVAEDIVNGDFEEISEGQWVGWTRHDAAFNFRGVTNQEKVAGVVMEKSGEYYFAGTVGGNPPMRGTLTSDVFKLGGNGFITFKVGAGKDTEKVYVDFFEEGNDTSIAHVVNEDCDGVYITEHLLTKVVDLSAYVGKNIYIVVTDNDDGSDLSYVNLDAFKVCQNDDEVAAAQAEYARQIEEFGPKPFVEDETSNEIQNPGFESGDLSGWVILDGTALSRAAIVPTTQYYWTDRAVYGEGEYYLDGSNNGAIQESLTGAIRSSKFTLGGDGYISFMIGSGNGGSYVALCDANTDEELIKMENEYFSDPALALTLLRVYMDGSEYVGRVVYLKVVDANDGSNGGFAFINVDDFRVSMTRDEVAALQVEQMEKIQNETYTSASYDDLTSLRNYYSSYPYLVPLESLTFTAYAENQVVDCGTVDLTAFVADASAAYGEETVDVVITKVNGEDIADASAVDMSEPHLLDYGANVFTGPSCLVDPVSGNIYMFSIMQDQRGAAEQGASGWAHTVGLARRIWINDEGTDLCIEPIEALHTLEGEVLIDGSNLSLDDANAQLSAVQEDMLYIRLDVDVSKASSFGITMLQGGKWDETSLSYDVKNGIIQGRTENKGEGAKVKSVSGALPNDDNILSVEIYLDRSLVEAFFEDSKVISIRAYPEDPNSQAISLFAEGDVTIVGIYVATMESIFD